MLLSDYFSKLMAAARLSADSNDSEPITSILSVFQMSECEAEDYKFKEINSAYELVEQDERLLVQYRWYDTSKPFSIGPDMNIYMLRHTKGDKIIVENEVKFLDKSIY